MHWLLLCFAISCEASLNELLPAAKRLRAESDKTSACERAITGLNDYYYSGFYVPTSDGLIHRIIEFLEQPGNEESIILGEDPFWTPLVGELTVSRDKHYVLFDKCVSLYRLEAPNPDIDAALANIYADRFAVTNAYETFFTTPLTNSNRLHLHRLLVGDNQHQGSMITELRAVLAIKNYLGHYTSLEFYNYSSSSKVLRAPSKPARVPFCFGSAFAAHEGWFPAA